MFDFLADVFASKAWISVGPLVGIIIGGLLSGALQMVNSRAQSRTSGVREIAAVRRSEYFDTIDFLASLEHLFNDMGAALSGRHQPDDDDDSDEAKEMRERDDQAASAIDSVRFLQRDLDRVVLRIAVVASPKVRDALDELRDSITSYMINSAQDGYFVADRFDEYTAELHSANLDIARLMRADLRVDKLYYSKEMAPRRVRRNRGSGGPSRHGRPGR